MAVSYAREDDVESGKRSEDPCLELLYTHCERNFRMSTLTLLIFSPFCLLCHVFVPVCGAYFT